MPALGICPGGTLPEFPLPCALSGDATARAVSPAANIKDFILESSEKIARRLLRRGDLESSLAVIEVAAIGLTGRLLLGLLLLLKGLLLLFSGFALSPLGLSPFLVIRGRDARAQNGESAVRVAARVLDHAVAVGITDPALVNRVVVAAAAHLIPGAVFPT